MARDTAPAEHRAPTLPADFALRKWENRLVRQKACAKHFRNALGKTMTAARDDKLYE